MAIGFGINGSTTDHGGLVTSTQSRSSQNNNLFLRAGDGFLCPKCRCWSTLIKSNDLVIFEGKAVAYVGDKFTCGATLLPKQSHVVGDAGGGGSQLIPLSNSLINDDSNLVDQSLYSKITLRSVVSGKFVPLGVVSFDGKPSKSELVFTFTIKKGKFDKIILEVEQNGNYIEVQKIEKLFKVGEVQNIKWDGFIKDTYNSNFMTNPKGVKFRIKGFLSGVEKAIDKKGFIFKYFDKDWMDVIINKRTNSIIINLRVNLQDGGDVGLKSGNGVPINVINQQNPPIQPLTSRNQTFNQLKKLAIDGMNYYWSRNNNHPTGKNVLINGKAFQVSVNTMHSNLMSLPAMPLIFTTNWIPSRSCNWEISRVTYYITGYVKFQSFSSSTWEYWNKKISDQRFKHTFAHEMGHELLLAYGGQIYSKKHKGSSTLFTQTAMEGTTYPRTGEIDLMKYADENSRSSRISQFSERSVAAMEDVLGLIYISGIQQK